METSQRHRRRLIDHVRLVVRDRALDPDGHTIEAVFHGPATRSAESVSIAF